MFSNTKKKVLMIEFSKSDKELNSILKINQKTRTQETQTSNLFERTFVATMCQKAPQITRKYSLINDNVRWSKSLKK